MKRMEKEMQVEINRTLKTNTEKLLNCDAVESWVETNDLYLKLPQIAGK